MFLHTEKIGIFDSGIGGFSILTAILKQIPEVDVDYISDDIFAPYGIKSQNEIIFRSSSITKILLDRGNTLIVVACNSATAAAIKILREKFPDTVFVGVEPYINVLNHSKEFPDIKKAAVITTELTGTSKKFKQLKARIDPLNKIQHIKMANLASIVEEILNSGYGEQQKKDLSEELKPLKTLGLSHLILGCTHYPLIRILIEKELDLITVSPGPFVAKRVQDLLSLRGGKPATSFSFLATSSNSWKTMSLVNLNKLLKFYDRELKQK